LDLTTWKKDLYPCNQHVSNHAKPIQHLQTINTQNSCGFVEADGQGFRSFFLLARNISIAVAYTSERPCIVDANVVIVSVEKRHVLLSM
jgi:hypothetical protein